MYKLFRQIIENKIIYLIKLDFNLIKFNQLGHPEEKIREIEDEIRKVLKYIKDTQNSLKLEDE